MNSISPTDFIFIRDTLKRETAILLDPGKEYLVESRLTPIVRSSQLRSMAELIGTLRKDSKHPLWKSVIEALTTNETSFFRDIEPYEILKNVVLPDLVKRRASSKSISIWSAACSSGQEPYSIAMLIRDTFPQLKDWNITIHATDICSHILDRARSGVFLQHEVNRGLPAIYLVKYFEKSGSQWQIKPEIKEMIKFSEFNLIKPINALPIMDIVMIRNVLIYFDLATKVEILARVRERLRPDGYLFLGSAETTLNIDNKFKRIPENKGSCFCLAG